MNWGIVLYENYSNAFNVWINESNKINEDNILLRYGKILEKLVADKPSAKEKLAELLLFAIMTLQVII
jgi:hypothetical protein